ncbi:transporter associated domain-containing protein, partial [Haloparvum sedimenti]|uniref:transporter associated domain-containing protein n=1 Tax=Haloparvum sedimenti TaxID=1678448 RepID=UPI00247FDB98
DGLLVKGEVTVGEVNDVLGTVLPRGTTYETVAGLINAELGRLGEAGDRVDLPGAGASLTVEAVERNRIRTVRVRRIEGSVEEGDTDADADADVPGEADAGDDALSDADDTFE